MCEAVWLSNRSKKELFIPQVNKKSSFNRENQHVAENKAEILEFVIKRPVPS